MIGHLHLASAGLALVFGALVLVQRKGTGRHVVTGRLYGLSMLLLNVVALSLYEQSGEWGPFHVLAAISLCTLAAGLVPLLLGRRDAGSIERHAYFMCWSYVGLIAAGVAQLTNRAVPWGVWLAVALPSLLVVSIGGFLVHRLAPRALRSVLRGASVGVSGAAVQLPGKESTRP